MNRFLIFALFAAFIFSASILFSQENACPELFETTFQVDWIQEDSVAPVGHWSVNEGYWLDEIPWGVFEAPWPSGWESGQVLAESESWTEVPEETLTNRQRYLLSHKLPTGHWESRAVDNAAQWLGPLLRWNKSRNMYELMITLS